jgi:hypothetical protein
MLRIISSVLVCFAATHPLEIWHERASIPGGQLEFNSVTWGNDLFVAVGGTRAAVSADGANWLVQNTGLTGSLFAVTHGLGRFVAVGFNNTLASSDDGTNWVSHGAAANNYHLFDVAFGNGRFVAAGRYGRILVSSNGVDWILASSPATWELRLVEFGNGLFVLPFALGTNLLSSDGLNWHPQTSGTARGLYTIGFGGGQFLAVDTDRKVWLSSGATNWTQHGQVTGIRPPIVGWGHGEFLIGCNPTVEYYQSGAWKPAPTNIWARGIAFGRGTFVVAAGSKLFQSDPAVKLQLGAPGALNIFGPAGVYKVESAPSLGSAASWQTETNLVITNSPARWIDPQGNQSRMRFYRVELSR